MLTHHAYYIEDSLSKLDVYVESIRNSEGFELGDPNFSFFRYEKFGIDEARSLIEKSSLLTSARASIILLGVGSITTEAQQALLKLFEEPQLGMTFVLLAPFGSLISTLKSRCLRFENQVKFAPGNVQTIAKDFLTWPYKKRSEWIVATLKDEDDARDMVRAFLNNLESELYGKIEKSKEVRESLTDIANFRVYLNDKGPSLKMILEHFAATLPTL